MAMAILGGNGLFLSLEIKFLKNTWEFWIKDIEIH